MFQQNLAAIKAKIESVRDESFITADKPPYPQIMAVSKRQPDHLIDEALASNHRLFGENRVQEAQSRWSERKLHYADLELHLIGPLQTNKVKAAVALFDTIQTIDRPALADALAAELTKQNKLQMPLYIQVNTGAETQKSGVSLANLPALIAYVKALKLHLVGLMCIPSIDSPPALHFALLKKLAARYNLPKTSMGMSSDYKYAAALGSDVLRIGSALFIPRS